ncbi:hypothetical protein MANES_05G134300v8 [Manihot esculenta]|uniref:Uncharacterized protein n=1 Tax=Manihot esculenta TaxID=3983 RepID=A0ACC8DNK4_MANES|nr:hypothetical protein MANES_05G134300v8 [Manihot esculenta]
MKIEMEVQIISKKNIKPSSPTPSHLRIFKFSLLDQLSPSSYSPLILFYPMNNNSTHPDVSRRLSLLKSSLSRTLTLFYPLAGNIKNELSIDCYDEGAYFAEARVSSCSLHEFLTQPDLLLIYKLLPCEFPFMELAPGSYVMCIQANVFSCDHFDGAALGTFLKGWTSAARSCNQRISPNFLSASLFPPNDELWFKNASFSISGEKCPTRVEVVSAFLWKSMMAASAELHGFQRPYLLTHLVNLRRRMEPSLTENSLGNSCEFSDLVGEVKKAISRIDAEFFKQIKGDEGKSVMSEFFKTVAEMGSGDEVDCFGFSSWSHFGYYGADFGWGKPVWVSSIGLTASVFMNVIVLVETRLSDGIEAWVTLDEPDMAILASNPELLKLALLIDDSV